MEDVHLQLHRTPLIGHAVDGVGHTGGQRDVQHVVASGRAGHRQAGDGRAGWQGAGRRRGDSTGGHPGRGVGRELHTQCIAAQPGRLQQRAGRQLCQVGATQTHLVQAVHQLGTFRPDHPQPVRVRPPGADLARAQGGDRSDLAAARRSGGLHAQLHRCSGLSGVGGHRQCSLVAAGAGGAFDQGLPGLAGQSGLHLLAGRGPHRHFERLTGGQLLPFVGEQRAPVQPQAIGWPVRTGRRRYTFDVQCALQTAAIGQRGLHQHAVRARRQRDAVARKHAGGVHGDRVARHLHAGARHGAAQQVQHGPRGLQRFIAR
jgi:hypothetical protein